jgi:hypothetical protein
MKPAGRLEAILLTKKTALGRFLRNSKACLLYRRRFKPSFEELAW